MKTSEQLDKICEALSKFQSEILPAKKDSDNPFFKSKYSDLNSIWNSIRSSLGLNGLSVVQDALTLPEGISIVTRVLHASGQWMEFGPLIIPIQKKDSHSTGSALSYAKRYSLSASLGIVSSDEDDDGNGAMLQAPRTSTPPVKSIDILKSVDIDGWYLMMDEKFDPTNLRDYVKEASEVMKKDEQETINHLSTMTVKKFEESFNRWLKKKNK